MVLVAVAVDGLLCTGQRENGGSASFLAMEVAHLPVALEEQELSTYR